MGGGRRRRRRRAAGGRMIGSVVLEIFPVEAVHAIGAGDTWRYVPFGLDDIPNDRLDRMGADADPPAFLLDGVVDALVARVTLGFHGVAGDGADRR